MKNELPQVLALFPGVRSRLSGSSQQQVDIQKDLVRGGLFALFLIYALMAIPLKSYSQPLIIMSVIPFGTIGALAGHWILGIPVSMFSYFGIIALSGVVVNDSLILVDYINKERDEGIPLKKAVIDAARFRFRPILLTSLTTFAGLTPMLLETEMQAQFLIPMAVSLSFGILFATIITLILVPCVYLMLNDVKKMIFAAESSAWDRHPQDVGRQPVSDSSSSDDKEVAASLPDEGASA